MQTLMRITKNDLNLKLNKGKGNIFKSFYPKSMLINLSV